MMELARHRCPVRWLALLTCWLFCSAALAEGAVGGRNPRAGAADKPDTPASGSLGLDGIFCADFSTAGWTLEGEWGIGATSESSGEQRGFPGPATDNSATADDGVAGMVSGGDVTAMAHSLQFLTSPTFDTTGLADLQLEFSRLPNIDEQPFNDGTVEVCDGTKWVVVWENPDSAFTTDSAWTSQAFDITAYANSALRVRLGLAPAKGGALLPSTMSGWNLDDLCLVGIAAVDDGIFADDFETDDTSAWSAVVSAPIPPLVDAVDTLVFARGVGAIALDPEADITDDDSDTLASLAATITENFSPGQDALSVLGAIPGTITATVLNGGESVELTPTSGASAPIGDFVDAVRQIGYFNNTAPLTIVPDRMVTITADDGGAVNSTHSDAITVIVPPRLPLALPNTGLVVLQDSVANVLDVTSDDVVTSGGLAEIVGLLADGDTDLGNTTQVLMTPRGTVSISPDRASIVFTPNAEAFTPPAGPLEQLQYVLSDGIDPDGPDRGLVSIRIEPLL